MPGERTADSGASRAVSRGPRTAVPEGGARLLQREGSTAEAPAGSPQACSRGGLPAGLPAPGPGKAAGSRHQAPLGGERGQHGTV